VVSTPSRRVCSRPELRDVVSLIAASSRTIALLVEEGALRLSRERGRYAKSA
jgi:hypothetical protein